MKSWGLAWTILGECMWTMIGDRWSEGGDWWCVATAIGFLTLHDSLAIPRGGGLEVWFCTSLLEEGMVSDCCLLSLLLLVYEKDGKEFSWSNLLAYSMGNIFIGVITETRTEKILRAKSPRRRQEGVMSFELNFLVNDEACSGFERFWLQVIRVWSTCGKARIHWLIVWCPAEAIRSQRRTISFRIEDTYRRLITKKDNRKETGWWSW